MIEDQVLEKWYEGDLNAFKILYTKYYGLGIGYCISLRADRELSKDLVQKTFVRIYEKVSTNKGKPIQNFRSYFYSSLTNCFLEHCRKTKFRIVPIEVLPPDFFQISLDSRIEKFMEEDYLEKLLSELNDDQKQVLKLQIQGYKQKEIAEMVNKTEDQVRGLSYRGKAKLREKNNHS